MDGMGNPGWVLPGTRVGKYLVWLVWVRIFITKVSGCSEGNITKFLGSLEMAYLDICG